jgi:hypothetical protein
LKQLPHFVTNINANLLWSLYDYNGNYPCPSVISGGFGVMQWPV